MYNSHSVRGGNPLGTLDSATQGLDWAILEIEEDEWERAIAGTRQASVLSAQGQSSQENLPGHQRQFLHTVAVRGALAVTLLLIWVYALWGKPSIGIDATNSISATNSLSGTSQINGTNLAARQSEVLHERTGEQSWGAIQSLDTFHLHFVYHARDAEAVQHVAAQAEAFYAQLSHILTIAQPGGMNSSALLTIEIVPPPLLSSIRGQPGIVTIASPGLNSSNPGVAATVLARQLRAALVAAAWANLPYAGPVKPQWRVILNGLHTWLLTSPKLPLAGSADDAEATSPANTSVIPRLDLLLAAPECPLAYQQNYQCQGVIFTGQLRSVYAVQLIDFLATEYGQPRLAALVQGMRREPGWKTMVPVVFGISQTELDAGWLQSAQPASH